MLHPALRYVIQTRYRNRLRSVLKRLKSPVGILAALFVGGMATAMTLGTSFSPAVPDAQRQAMLSSFLAFLLILGVLGGVGQRGLLFAKAD